MHMIAALGRWRRASLTANGISMVRREVRAKEDAHMSTEKGVLPGLRSQGMWLGKPVISLHLEVGEYARQSSYSEPRSNATSLWMVSAWRRDMPRAGQRAGLGVERDHQKRYQHNVFLHKQPSTETNFALEHDKLKELSGERGCESGIASPKWGREHAWSLWASTCILPHSAVVAAEQH
ncbi:hypothetical protein B0H13DRAFT_2075955 [Mycena leptocephala]|nr:hypothetical protein B0H13DRAFT_2075955 [Mycena leptocephala]